MRDTFKRTDMCVVEEEIMGHCSGLKRKEQPSHEKTWRGLTCTAASGRSQSGKATMLYDPNHVIPGKGKTSEVVKR